MIEVRKLLRKDETGRYWFVLEPRYDKGELIKEILRSVAVGSFIIGSMMAPNVVQLAALFIPPSRPRV